MDWFKVAQQLTLTIEANESELAQLKAERDELRKFVEDLLAIINKHGGISGCEQVVAAAARAVLAKGKG